MAKLNSLFVVHTTKNVANAETDADFHLFITVAVPVDDAHRSVTLLFPDQPHDERERGRTDSYRFDVSHEHLYTERGLTIWMTMLNGTDGWLPKSVFLIGVTDSGESRVLGGHPDWPSGQWFDRGDPAHDAGYVIARTS